MSIRRVILTTLIFIAFYFNSTSVYAGPGSTAVPAAPVVITSGFIFMDGNGIFTSGVAIKQKYAGQGFSVNSSGYVSSYSDTYIRCYFDGCVPGSIVSASAYASFSTSDQAFQRGTVTVGSKTYAVGGFGVRVGGTYNFVSPSIVFPNVNTPVITLSFPFQFNGYLIGYADHRKVFRKELMGRGIATVRFTGTNVEGNMVYRATNTTYNFQSPSSYTSKNKSEAVL